MPQFLGIEAPPITRRVGGLLDTADVHPLGADAHRASLGVAYPNQGLCGTVGLTPDECFVDNGSLGDADKDFNGYDDVTSIEISAYYGLECWLDGAEDYTSDARRGLEFKATIAIEKGFQARVLDDTPTATYGTTAAPLAVAAALGRLEQAIATVAGGVALIHVPLGAVNFLVAQNLVVRNLDGSLETFNGNKIVAGAGYQPAWGGAIYFPIWATSMVHIYPGAVAANAGQDRLHNTSRALAEQSFALTMDCPDVYRAYVTTA